MLVKICGLLKPADAQVAVAAGADMVSVIFAPARRRRTLAQARAIFDTAPAHVERVGVFVDADDGLIADAVNAASLDAIQLHGQESAQRVAEVRQRFGKPVWKVLPVAGVDDVAKAEKFSGAADFLLFDA